jgi:hypothetical protein
MALQDIWTINLDYGSPPQATLRLEAVPSKHIGSGSAAAAEPHATRFHSQRRVGPF